MPIFKKHTMESVVRFFDDVDDFFTSTSFRLRRLLSRKPRETAENDKTIWHQENTRI